MAKPRMVCLRPQEIVGLVFGTLSETCTTFARGHLQICIRCQMELDECASEVRVGLIAFLGEDIVIDQNPTQN